MHSGGIHGGHYYAFIRPQLQSNQWFKFDDERVTKESAKKAVEEQYGGEEEVRFVSAITSGTGPHAPSGDERTAPHAQAEVTLAP